ncbi:MAG: ATP-binding protein [Thermoguttaceae bacterium]|jgi:two-component system phosphate regulon sensor histidine kinase PhoR
MRRRRLSWQIALTSFCIALLIAIGLGSYTAYRVADSTEKQVWSKLEMAANASALRLAGEWTPNGPPPLADTCRELNEQLGVRLTIVLPSGKVLTDTVDDPAILDNHRERPEIVRALAGTRGQSTRPSVTRKALFMFLAVPVQYHGQIVAAVRTSQPRAELTAALWKLYAEIAGVGLLAVLLITSGSLLATRRLVRALNEIRRGADHFAHGQWKYRLPENSSVEIGMLAESLNAMAAQLDERIQKVLRQQSEHQAMLSSMEEGVMAVDRTGAVLSVNDPCASLLGVDSAKLRGRNLYEVLRKPDLLKFIENSQASTKSLDGDLRFYNPEERWLHAHGTALHDARGQKIGVLIVLYDVTRLRHLENVRRDFVANVSHELRTPITSIKGFVETLLDDGLGDQANAMRFLGIVLRQVNRLDAIINDLLLLSRIERGNEDQRIETDAEPLVQVLEAARETCEKKAQDKSIRIAVDCPQDLVAKINAPLLEQAVINLIDNAIKYSEAGATVRVIAGSDQSGAVIRVIDNGCGIAANHLSRLFERFYRVDKARSRELGGTGLGLAIVKHIMAAHLGSVHVESVVGRGSTFTLRLPLSLPISDETPAVEPVAAGVGPTNEAV